MVKLVFGTLRAALSRSEHTAEPTVHSDQGWHYKMQPYRTMLARRGVTQSVSCKGNCFDDAVIETFFGTLKAKYFHLARSAALRRSKRACTITSATTTTSESSSHFRGSARWNTG